MSNKNYPAPGSTLRAVMTGFGICLLVVLAVSFAYLLDQGDSHQQRLEEQREVMDKQMDDQVRLIKEATDKVIEGSRLRLVEFNFDSDGTGPFISGSIANNSGNSYGYVQIDFDLYDEFGDQIGSTSASIPGLDPNKTRTFRVPVKYDDVYRVKLVKITGR